MSLNLVLHGLQETQTGGSGYATEMEEFPLRWHGFDTCANFS